MTKQKDSAKGPATGYIFQFELALLELAKMESAEFFLAIEELDDLSIQKGNGTCILTVQAKHSIVASSKSYGSTSQDLWRTLQIWVDKLDSGVLTSGTKFKAISNKDVPRNSIVRDFGLKEPELIIKEIKKLKSQQEKKLKAQQEKKLKTKKGTNESGNSIKNCIASIESVLASESSLKTVISNFELQSDLDVMDATCGRLQISSFDDKIKVKIYEGLVGWIAYKSISEWKQGGKAEFTKSDFEIRFNDIRKKHPITQAYFRSRADVLDTEGLNLSHENDSLYVKQIKDIDRDSDDKERILNSAIFDFVSHQIELSYLIDNTAYITQSDFEQFELRCYEEWQKIKMQKAPKSIDNYTKEELNDLAIMIFDEIMHNVKLEFQGQFGFDEHNRYIQNGTFLTLSDRPKIGWNPNWKKLYSGETS